MDSLRLILFGYPELFVDGIPVRICRKKAVALLAYLGSTQRVHGREELAALLWGDHPDSRALASLREALMVLRHILGKEILRTDRETVRLVPKEGFFIDTVRFGRLSTEWKSGKHRTGELLLDLTSLYGGGFLQGFSLHRCETFEDWQQSESKRFQREYLCFLEELISYYRKDGMYDHAIECGLRFLATDPWNEDMHRQVMSFFAKKGCYSLAVKQFRYCEKILKEELQVSPSERTRLLLETILMEGDAGGKNPGTFPL